MYTQKSTLVLGASPFPYRYAHRAVRLLQDFAHPVQALGKNNGKIGEVSIYTEKDAIEEDIHTVSIYLSPLNQDEYYDWILDLNPQRVIFNPGAENPFFEDRLKDAGIHVQRACTLVMLNVGNY